jgi:hypothetical protein
VRFNLKRNSNIYSYMTKQKKLFTFENNDVNIDMNVDEALYNHFQSLSPLEKKRIQDLMTLKLLEQMCE